MGVRDDGVMTTELASQRGESNGVRRLGGIHILLGVVMLAGAIAGLRWDVAWLAQPFYAWAWWGYILLLDGYCARKRQSSLLTNRRHCVLPICLWSITFWFFFELINGRIQNWYYVGVFPLDDWVSGSVFAVAAFATVFMGIFQTIDALGAAGLWRRRQPREKRFSRRLTYVLQWVGLVMGGLALFFPHYLAPLIWGSVTLMVDPWNYRRGAVSLLRDLEEGDYGRLGRLLLAGLICGVVWESLNFFAPQKWIYTVRGLEGVKVFEMPLIGFLGFPALALDCVAVYAMFSSWLLGNRTWDNPADLSCPPVLRVARSRGYFWSTALAQMIFWAAVASAVTPINVASLQVELQDLGLTAPELQRLAQHGITRPRQFLQAIDATDGATEAFHMSASRLEELRQRARLYTFKGIGSEHGRMLESVGVRSPDDLKTWEPEVLHNRLRLCPLRSASPLARPRLDFVRAWILASRDQAIIQYAR